MRTQLIALLVGGAMLGQAGSARADAVTLTEAQMDTITAGHLYPNWQDKDPLDGSGVSPGFPNDWHYGRYFEERCQGGVCRKYVVYGLHKGLCMNCASA